MSKQRKLQNDAIKLLADGISLSDAAKKLAIARSTIHRWMARPDFAKSLEDSKRGTLKDKFAQVEQATSPNKIGEFTDNSNKYLLALAVDALRMSRDVNLSESIRLNAMARFQSLLKDIRLLNPADEKGKPRTAANAERKPGASTKDPRGILSAVG